MNILNKIFVNAAAVLVTLCPISSAYANSYSATTAVGALNGTVLTDNSGANGGYNYLWYGPGFNTVAYQNIYNSYAPPPAGFYSATDPTYSLVAQPNTDYSVFTVSLKGAGTYNFSVIQPGTTLSSSPTTFDLTAALYVSAVTATPFNTGALFNNLVAYSDDATRGAGLTDESNPFPLSYINTDPASCVTMTLVFFSWGGVSPAVANIQANGPGTVAATCAAVDAAIAANATSIPTLSESKLIALTLLLALFGAWFLRNRNIG